MVLSPVQKTLADSIIQEQLSRDMPSVFTRDGWSTSLTPVCAQRPCGEKLSLDGDWAVFRWPFPREEHYYASPDVFDLDWPRVRQPGKVFTQDPETRPASVPGYDRVTLAHIDPDDGAMLRRTVEIPAAWEGKRIFINLDAVYPAARIYVNGKLLADHRSGLTPLVADITAYVKPGRPCVIGVRLLRRHPFVQLDMARHSAEFCGISQPACLFAVEKLHIEDYCLPAALDDALTTGTLAGTVTLRNDGAPASGTLTLTLTAPDGTLAGRTVCTFDAAVGRTEVGMSLSIPAPLLWNDEHPHLYTAVLTLDAVGQKAEIMSFRVGFKKLVFRDSRAYLNGHPIKLRGVNHLTYHPQYGLYTPEVWLRKNLTLMKQANVNCIRTHYLGPRVLAELCDELGFYLIQELPIDWGTHFIHDPAWVGPALMRLQGGVLRDRNHVSVTVWAIGNENMSESLSVADMGRFHLMLYDRFVKVLDREHPTMFPPPGPAGPNIRAILELSVGDIADTHYSFNAVKTFLKEGKSENPIAWTAEKEVTTREEALARGWSGTWFSSEYGLCSMNPDLLTAAKYTSVIDDEKTVYPDGTTPLKVFTDRLTREWGFMRSEPTCLGGAYFPWLSSGSSESLGHPFSWTVLAEDNDWGVMTPELLPKPAYWALRNLFAPVWFPAEAEVFTGEDEVTFEVENQYNDVNLADCTLRFTIGNGTRDWFDVHPDIAPGQAGTVRFPVWSEKAREALAEGTSQMLRVFLIDPTGFVATSKDLTVYTKGRTRAEAYEFDVGPQPEYVDRKAQ